MAINGTQVLTNFDIYATAGAAYTAVVEQYTEPANSSGDIVIALTDGAANQPMINGIEILDATPCTTIPSRSDRSDGDRDLPQRHQLDLECGHASG